MGKNKQEIYMSFKYFLLLKGGLIAGKASEFGSEDDTKYFIYNTSNETGFESNENLEKIYSIVSVEDVSIHNIGDMYYLNKEDQVTKNSEFMNELQNASSRYKEIKGI